MDFVFYFANSTSGGGMVRLRNYWENISRPSLFIVHPTSLEVLKNNKFGHKVVTVAPTAITRLLSENHYLKATELTGKILFSHGAPLISGQGKIILHMNNALPLFWRHCKLDLKLKIKMFLLEKRLKKAAGQAQLISVESFATKDLVRSVWGEIFFKKCVILSNGVEPVKEEAPTSLKIGRPYALSIGAYSYKRIDEVIKVFQEQKKQVSNLQLVIIGTSRHKASNSSEDILFTPNLPYLQTRYLMKNADMYISMSEIENCSISLLEGAFYNKKIVCSSIPSHLEALSQSNYKISEDNGSYVVAYPNQNVKVPNWVELSLATQVKMEELLK